MLSEAVDDSVHQWSFGTWNAEVEVVAFGISHQRYEVVRRHGCDICALLQPMIQAQSISTYPMFDTVVSTGRDSPGSSSIAWGDVYTVYAVTLCEFPSERVLSSSVPYEEDP